MTSARLLTTGKGGGDEQSQPLDALLTYDQAGEMLGVTGRTVSSMVKRGDLVAVRFGGSVRFDPADLRAFVERCKLASNSDNAGESRRIR